MECLGQVANLFPKCGISVSRWEWQSSSISSLCVSWVLLSISSRVSTQVSINDERLGCSLLLRPRVVCSRVDGGEDFVSCDVEVSADCDRHCETRWVSGEITVSVRWTVK